MTKLTDLITPFNVLIDEGMENKVLSATEAQTLTKAFAKALRSILDERLLHLTLLPRITKLEGPSTATPLNS